MAQVDKGEIDASTDVVTLPASALRLAPAGGAGGSVIERADEPSRALPTARVLRLHEAAESNPLDWLPLEDFKATRWQSGLPRRVGDALQGTQPPAGLGLAPAQMKIMKDCMQSLATSRD